MASQQANANEAIAQAVVEATRVAVQAMGVAGADRTQNMGPRLCRPLIRQNHF